MEWTPDRIRLFRATGLYLPQPKFAKELGFARRTIGNAERGTHPPSLALRRALDQALEQASDTQRNRFLAAVAGLPDVASRANCAAQDSKAWDAALPPADARQLVARLDDIAQRYETLPSASLLAEAGQCHASIRLLLRHTSALSESVRQKPSRMARSPGTWWQSRMQNCASASQRYTAEPRHGTPTEALISPTQLPNTAVE